MRLLGTALLWSSSRADPAGSLRYRSLLDVQERLQVVSDVLIQRRRVLRVHGSDGGRHRQRLDILLRRSLL